MTEQSPDTERPTWRESSAQEPLPRRKPPALGGSAPGSGGGSLFEKPQRATPPADDLGEPPLPPRGPVPLPQRGAQPLPQRGGDPLPQRGAQPLPQRGAEPLPQ
ncbi:MAG: hypothetical protein ACRDPO_08980, partial [Streptosporangiaceae bacterium]